MPFDPENPKHIGKLCESIDWSTEKARAHREQYVENIRQMAGSHYGDHGTETEVPINMIELGVNIFQREISAHEPQALVNSAYDELLPGAADMELALNQEIDRMNLGDSFNTCGIEALFCLGMMKVGITTGDTPPNGEGHLHDPGHLFADPVLFGDAILDMTAKRWEQQSYMGDEFTVPLEWAKENPQFNKEARQKLSARSSEQFEAETHAESMTRGESNLLEEFEDMVQLRQIFLPRQQLILTLAVGENKLPLSIVEWTGPEHGPYHRLSFGKVPGNLIPLAPVPLWVDLHDITNSLFNKAARQAERQKTFTALPKRTGPDGELLTTVEDGGVYSFENPSDIHEVSTGGANEHTLSMAIWAQTKLEYMGGNWAALGGLGAQTKTVGQDEMLHTNASGRLKDMQQLMLSFQAAVIKDLAYWLWEDPLSEYHIIKRPDYWPSSLPGIPAQFSPENRMGRFFDYNFDVDPFKRPRRSPSEQAAQFMSLIRDFVLPMMPMLEQQGKSLDVEYIFKEISRLNNSPQLSRAIVHLQGEQYPSRGKVSPGMPAQTTRTYERVNRPAASAQGQDQALASALMGAPKQPAEMASLMRTAG